MLSDGGLETVLIFHEGIDLPAFAAFPLLDHEEGRAALRRYFGSFLQLAADAGRGFVLETPTWRAQSEWGATIGYSPDALRRINHEAVAFARDIRSEHPDVEAVLVSGCVGPRGDGYVASVTMNPSQALDHHRAQVSDLAAAGADLVTAFTFSYVDEAIGFVTAAAEVGIASVVGFTVETDGRLPSGMALGEAIEAVDDATGSAAAWFMINCAHPDHVLAGIPTGDNDWRLRIGALRANASRLSHAELDEAVDLDDGDPADFAASALRLGERLGELYVVGGCCGTDIRHVSALSSALNSAEPQ